MHAQGSCIAVSFIRNACYQSRHTTLRKCHSLSICVVVPFISCIRKCGLVTRAIRRTATQGRNGRVVATKNVALLQSRLGAQGDREKDAQHERKSVVWERGAQHGREREREIHMA